MAPTRTVARRPPDEDVVRSFESTFESYWADPHFEDYVPVDFAEAVRRTSDRDDSIAITPFDINPHPFQRQVLEQVEVKRGKRRPHRRSSR